MLETWTNLSNIIASSIDLKFGKHIKPGSSDHYDSSIPVLGLLGEDTSTDSVRIELFKLSDQISPIDLIDLGNIKPDEQGNLPHILKSLSSHNIVPILISSTEKSMVYHLQHALSSQLLSNWLFVHPSLLDQAEIQSIISDGVRDGVMKVRYAGHQTHITSADAMHRTQELQIECMRLGHIRQNIDRIEPWCRSLDHAGFHLDSLRKTDYHSKSSSNPGGLFYEEACKICQFIGASSHLQSLGIYGYDASRDPDRADAAVIAQMIWYFIDGYIHFREEKSIQKSKLIQYTVHASHSDLDINFWKNNESGRWWMEVPGHQDHWVSCTYDDYLEASHGEFSSRLINVLNRR